MRSRRCSCALVTGTTFLMTITTVFMGTDTLDAGTVAKHRVQDAPEQTPIEEPRLQQLDFPGGSCQSYVDTLATMFPDSSVILAPGVADFQIPKIKVSLRTIMPALKLACGIQGDLVYHDRSRGEVHGSLAIEPIARNIIRINGMPDEENVSARGRQRTVRPNSGQTLLIYPLGPILNTRMSIEEINRSLDIAFGMIPQDKPAIFYQESTAIFFLYGTEEQNDIFTETIYALEGVAVHRGKSREREVADEKATANETRNPDRRKQAEERWDRLRNGARTNE